MKTYDLIKKLLIENKELRDSDKKLLWKVWEHQGIVQFGHITYENFISPKLTSAETIRRTRQKIQELHPHLKGSEKIQQYRKEIQRSKGTWIFRDNTAYLQ